MRPESRRRAALYGALAWLAACLPRAPLALAAPPAPPLVLYWAPPGAPPEVASARAAIAETARDSGSAFVDLSPAAPSAPTAPALLRRAIEDYDAFRYDDARTKLEAAEAEAAESGAAGLTPAQLGDLHLYRALVATQRGETAAAWDEYVRAATLDPARTLDGARFPPRVTEAFARAEAAARAATRGVIDLDVPAGTRAWVDAREVTAELASPAPLPFGEHYLRLERAGAPAFGAKLALAEEKHVVRAPMTPFAPPTDARLGALAHERNAAAYLAVTVTVSPGAPPTIWLRTVDVSTGVARAQASVALDAGGAASADAAAAAKRLLAPPAPVVTVPPPPKPGPTPFYRRPWFWGVVGAAAAAAVILPLTVGGSSGPTSFDVRPAGTPLW